MQTRIVSISVTFMLVMVLAGCGSPNGPTAAAGVVQASSDLMVDAAPGEIGAPISLERESGQDVVLIQPLARLGGNWGAILRQGAPAAGRFEMTLRSNDQVTVELKHKGCHSFRDEEEDTCGFATFLDQMPELQGFSPKSGDPVTGCYQIELLPSDEVIIRLRSGRCD